LSLGYDAATKSPKKLQNFGFQFLWRFDMKTFVEQ
jgi:hypothetical protein